MKQKKQCHHDEGDVILYFYGELTGAPLAEVEAHLQVCPSCCAVLDEMRAMEDIVPALPSVVPDDATMSALRRAVGERLRPRTAQVERPWWRPAPLAMRFTLGVALVAVGFLWGRMQADKSGGLGADAFDDLLYASRPVEAAGGTINPYLAGVQSVALDPETGTVGIRYSTHNDVFVRGRPTDPGIRQLLHQALADPDHPVARLDAVKVVGRTLPDADLTSALTKLILDEPMEGIRIRAIQALRLLHAQTGYPPTVKEALLNILLNDQSSALRIEAMQALTEGALGGEDTARHDLANQLKIMENDPNGFIRIRAASMLRDLERSGPLERLPSSE